MISAWTHDNKVWASTRRNGKLEIRALAGAEYVGFVRSGSDFEGRLDFIDSAADFPGWIKLWWSDYETRKKDVEANPDLIFEGDVNPVRRFMSDNKCEVEVPKRCFYDFETDSDVSPKLLHVDNPKAGRLLSFAIKGADHRIALALEDWNDQAEAELWAEYWRITAHYDQAAAWNSDRFDDLVRELRCRELARKFPRILGDIYWEHRKRILFVDHLLCFKRHHMAPESGDDKTSLKLNDVGQALIGEGKHDFDARFTTEAWRAGGAERQRMVDYNMQDTELLEKIEAETGYLDLQQTLAEVTLTFANTHGLKPMPQVDGYLLRMAHRRQTHLPSKKTPTGMEKQYEGAFVLPPQDTGILRMVHVCDFKSLYPTVIRSFNISPDTKDQPGCVAFRTEVSFGLEQEGMVPAACREGMEKRDEWKKKAKANPDDKYAERMNKAYKIFCNSIYGVMGSKWSRYYDVEIAESITLGAKHLILATAEAAKEKGWTVTYMDTDSLFVMGCTVEEFKDFVTACNKELYPRLLDERGVPREQQCIELDYEKCFKRLVFPINKENKTAAKRYFGSYEHYAFKPKTKPEIRGLEYMRGDGVRRTRHLQKELIGLILGEQEPSAELLEEWVSSQRNDFMMGQVPIEDIVVSQSISKDALSDYKVKGAHVRIAEEMEENGEDVSSGTRIAYVVTDGSVSPVKAILASDYTGEFDRHYLWMKKIYPALMRILTSAAPSRNWQRWVGKRPKRALKGQLSLLG
jgi:DNA polymerase elongation subunit (family B)